MSYLFYITYYIKKKRFCSYLCWVIPASYGCKNTAFAGHSGGILSFGLNRLVDFVGKHFGRYAAQDHILCLLAALICCRLQI